MVMFVRDLRGRRRQCANMTLLNIYLSRMENRREVLEGKKSEVCGIYD
jgi:hypothetical protein